ncbi:MULTISPECIES: cyclic peptide export ABC transporter [Photorhabdus]|uniref:Cyclic peptide export ABC transporter n=1 Tax=Photorhabdus bodei TaxID=2029681 RepID=A0AAW6BQ93_9GAMM|nr:MULTISPECIES: cyclic peptide export ABC transporter [Photorhabdus]MCT8354537.1 cyclic peptide export ABC transporter [Photorhabdus kayaii]MDB6369500.1 cyclic peptide export ABC transporter [Photorhabdus bodei]MDB6374152.1 cyclic peptide export ABC transporter [Photorhabdus bodei]
MNLIRYLCAHSWKLLCFSMVSALVAGGAAASLVGLVSKAIESPGYSVSYIFFILCLVYFFSKATAEIALLHLTQSAILSLRINLSNKLLRTPFKKQQELGRHGLLAVLTKDVDVFSDSCRFAPIVFGNTILIVACLSYLAWVSWVLFLVLTVCFGTLMYGFHILEKNPSQMMDKVREQIDNIYLNFQNLISGSKELQLNTNRGKLFVNQVIMHGAENLRKIFIKSHARWAWLVNSADTMFYVIIGFMVFVVPIWWPSEPGVLVSVVLVMLFLVGPIGEVMGAIPELRTAEVSLKRMRQLDKDLQESQLVYSDKLNPFLEVKENKVLLELQDVVHHYSSDKEDSQFILGPLNLKIHHEEIVFIIGGNGSGKTTLAMLLVGLFQCDSGSIILNGVEMNASNNEYYRQFFSAVFSDFHLFEELLTIDSHITDKATHYIQKLGMDHKVKVVDGKFSTINISTGQRKRLALVSAYLEDRPVYIFDEWAADQDPVFKKVFYTELLPELKARGKTVIVITHDDSYFGVADRVVKLEDGHIKDI